MGMQGNLLLKEKVPFTGYVRVLRVVVENPLSGDPVFFGVCQVLDKKGGTEIDCFNSPYMPYESGRDPRELAFLAVARLDSYKDMEPVLEPGQSVGVAPESWPQLEE